MTVQDENKKVVRRFFDEVVNQRNFHLVDALVSTNNNDHTVPPGTDAGPEGMRQFLKMVTTAFPDMHIAVEDMVAEGDKVAVRITVTGTHKGMLMGIPPTNKRATWSGLDIIRLKDGKFVERWGLRDFLGMFQQLGIVTIQGQQ